MIERPIIDAGSLRLIVSETRLDLIGRVVLEGDTDDVEGASEERLANKAAAFFKANHGDRNASWRGQRDILSLFRRRRRPKPYHRAGSTVTPLMRISSDSYVSKSVASLIVLGAGGTCVPTLLQGPVAVSSSMLP